MTGAIVDDVAPEGNGAYALAWRAGWSATTGPEALGALASAADFEEFETDTARGFWRARRPGFSETLSRADAEREAPACPKCKGLGTGRSPRE